jgi:hypothetical protein
MLEELFSKEAAALGNSLIQVAKKGDVAALTFVIRRLVPVRHGYPVQIDLPPIESANDLVKALSVIAQQMAQGKLTPEEASQAVNVLEGQRRAMETSDLARRLAIVEKAQEKQRR